MPSQQKKINSPSSAIINQILNLDISTYEKNLLLNTNKKLTPSIINKISKGFPVEYAVNKTIWYGVHFYVNSSVLIPRHETEQVVEIVNSQVSPKEKYVFLDIGTGSGAIIITLAKTIKQNPDYCFIGSDISPKAIKVSQTNKELHITPLNNNVSFYTGSLIHTQLKNLLLEKYKEYKLIIIANLPYLSSQDATVSSKVKKHEPHLALFAKNDGLYLYQKLFKQILRYKIPFHSIILEIDAEKDNNFIKVCKQFFPNNKISFTKDINLKNRFITIT